MESKARYNYKLVLIGIKTREKKIVDKFISSLGLSKSVIVAPYLDRSYLIDLLQRCEINVIPSSEEGYGIPLLEALVYSKRIVCSDIKVFREIADGYANFVDINKPFELAKILDSVLQDKSTNLKKFDFNKFKENVLIEKSIVWKKINEL